MLCPFANLSKGELIFLLLGDVIIPEIRAVDDNIHSERKFKIRNSNLKMFVAFEF